MMLQKMLSCILAAAMTMSLSACSHQSTTAQAAGEPSSTSGGSYLITKIGMVTDTGGINDQSFNQSAWEGLQELNKETGIEVNYLESRQQAEYPSNLDKQVDTGDQMIWGNGFTVGDATLNASAMNPDVLFAVVDLAFEDAPDNVIGVVFKAQESSFLAGYAAAKTTVTNKVGFVGGQKSDTIGQFEWGYKAGVYYGAGELGKEVAVDAQYADSFADSAKGKAIANKMYSDGCDIIFHAAGGTGLGVIDAAKEAGKLVIGVDRDQSYLAPDNVLTSAMKNVDIAVKDISLKASKGEIKGGQNFEYGLAEGSVGIPENHPNMDPDVYEATVKLEASILDGSILVPMNQAAYSEFIKKEKTP